MSKEKNNPEKEIYTGLLLNAQIILDVDRFKRNRNRKIRNRRLSLLEISKSPVPTEEKEKQGMLEGKTGIWLWIHTARLYYFVRACAENCRFRGLKCHLQFGSHSKNGG
ncbi:hypothetical protein CDAR_121861 [Caerostris darwini]|uniref:Uncharacterized protein n=1 Tax=Caerostris darwini TaxID=1538125 RepID=A0AAV4R2B7_9ARAC|nr:hypothetical protein CDAR_121861 [Caerostris darwini]